jgi:hypothetical protein
MLPRSRERHVRHSPDHQARRRRGAVLKALQEKLLRQDLFDEFCEEFTREMNLCLANFPTAM